MIDATSAGAILYRDTRGKREYLLLKSRPGDWEFPKGGVEGNEELQQTAIREVKEEAGIDNFRTCSSRNRSRPVRNCRKNTATTSGATTTRRSIRSPRTAPAISSRKHTNFSTRRENKPTN